MASVVHRENPWVFVPKGRIKTVFTGKETNVRIGEAFKDFDAFESAIGKEAVDEKMGWKPRRRKRGLSVREQQKQAPFHAR